MVYPKFSQQRSSLNFLLRGHLYYSVYSNTGNPQFALCKSKSTNMTSGKPYRTAKGRDGKAEESHILWRTGNAG